MSSARACRPIPARPELLRLKSCQPEESVYGEMRANQADELLAFFFSVP